ncbi:ATP-binding protein [Shewanella sp. Isolate11]|uniref:ATP-binding protein n=1 Tax=Shewanella sp. Isolate11 TaxID=2908530 RepID=UPI001EFD90DE|nr:ATP-binding protein [Shewanella sp. Isolate11]MCG9696356.1 ATP-binding protein [Shewanella sp. Isolate11]
MQLKFPFRRRLLTRMFVTALSLIALVGFGLAWLINILFAQNHYNEETAKLIAEIPKVAAELKEHNIIPENTNWLEENTTPQKYILASCDQDYRQIWSSSRATVLGLFDTCERFNSIRFDSPPYYLTLADSKNYFLYLLPVELGKQQYNLLVIKDAQNLEQELDKFSHRTYWRLGMIIALALFLLISAGYWGMRPLVRLRNELQQVSSGKAQSLSQDYPVELEGVTQALNQLLVQSNAQQERYQNAMNDLAHSLKTRLAAVHAITDDNSLSKSLANDKIMEQISQMDQLVKYQLKRAMLGRKGLKQQQTLVAPLIDQLSQMLFKVYRDKQVQLHLAVSAEQVFPGDEGDLMELCGNLMENAFKMCISQVGVSASYSDNGEFVLIIEDDGPGIAENIRKRILQRGVRADTQRPGQGIGLAVCHEIVSSYNGTLNIETSELEGAKFIIRIPL